MNFWESKRVLVTGGASFIGSHLVDMLIRKNVPYIRVVDDLSSGVISNINAHLKKGNIDFFKHNLLDPEIAISSVQDIDVIFHLAAIHGGRGYVDMHQAACSNNLIIDGLLVKAAYEANVTKFIFASSGCVYPNYLQMDINKILYLNEQMVGPPYDPDNMYGWAKLSTELMLQAYYREYGFKSASCRFFTVYGERGLENHAIIAMIARAFLKMDPFEVWGDGQQIRNWTHVNDIVRGMILAAEYIENGIAINLGTEERIRVIDAVNEILHYTGHKANIKLMPNAPTGPLNRVANSQLAKELLSWSPEISFIDGLHRTIDWYYTNKNRDDVLNNLTRLLTER